MSVEDEDIRKQEEIEKIRESRKNLENAVRALPEIREDFKQLREELCVGPDCLKSQVTDKFSNIDEKIKKIEEKQSDLLCDRCGYIGVPSLSSYCPNCGAPIFSWNDDEDRPIKGWKHWSERNK